MILKPQPNGKSISSPAELFERHVDRAEGCWPWKAYRNKAGYGFTRVGGRGARGKLAHRLSWEVHKGAIPDGLHVLHRCDNPCCVNPDHLFLGTNLDNIKDRMQKGRPGSQAHAGKPSPNRRITDAQVAQIVSRFAAGERRGLIAADFDITPEHVWRIGTRRVRATKC